MAVYGGYFGAGIGILMLAVLGFLGLRDIHAMNGLKNFFGACINAVAAGYFVWRGAVNAEAAAVMIAGAIAGGYAGARFARWIGQERARRAVVVVGLADYRAPSRSAVGAVAGRSVKGARSSTGSTFLRSRRLSASTNTEKPIAK